MAKAVGSDFQIKVQTHIYHPTILSKAGFFIAWTGLIMWLFIFNKEWTWNFEDTSQEMLFEILTMSNYLTQNGVSFRIERVQ